RSETEAAEELREEKETVEKIDDDRTKIVLTEENELVEENIQDCKNRYEIIIMKESERHKRPMTCYLRKMDDALYSSACLGTKNMPFKAFTIADEVVDKDFLSQDGPDSVCRYLPMFTTKNVNDVNKDGFAKTDIIKRLPSDAVPEKIEFCDRSF
ncbi:hypothetical protein ACJMK2_010981, partial [Sinanodonta woodiana]